MSAIKKLVLANLNATKARLSEGRQLIGIRNLEIPDEVQPRKVFEKSWAADLAKWFKEGTQFPEVRVYQLLDGRLIQAEGHHRRFALQSIGEDDILCDVANGTMEDAIIYAAGSNRENRGILQMSDKGITKAVGMLFGFEKWWTKPNAVIAKHVGCSSTKIGCLRRIWSEKTGVSIPEFFVRSDGRTARSSRRNTRESIVIGQYNRANGEPMYWSARYKGKEFRGTNKQDVKEILRKEFKNEDRRLGSLKHKSIMSKLRSYGFLGAGWKHTEIPGFSGVVMAGIVAVSCDFREAASLAEAIGNLKLLFIAVGRAEANRQKCRQLTRSVVLCYREDGPKEAIELFEEAGIEFMTPDELIASLGPVIPEEIKEEAQNGTN